MGEIFELTREQLETFAENNRPKYIYFENYNKNDNIFDGYYGVDVKSPYQRFICTACGREWCEDGHGQQHKHLKQCPGCGIRTTAYNEKFGRSSKKEHMNCIIFYKENHDSVWAECVRIDIEDYTDIWDPNIYIDRRTLYHFFPGGGQRYRRKYDRWEPMKSRAGYTFYTGLGTVMAAAERAHFYIRENIADTFLERFQFHHFPDDGTGCGTLAYLMACCEAPAFCEFCSKAKLWELMSSRLFKNYAVSKKLRYKAQSVADIFHTLDKPRRKAAINFLCENRRTSAGMADELVTFLEKNTPDYFRAMNKLFGSDFLKASEVIEKTGQTPKKLLNYTEKQHATIRLYADYIKECVSLGYDLTDSIVLHPKNLREKHEETSRLCRYKTNDAESKKAEKRAELLRKNGAEYRRGRLMIVVPNNTVEIIQEGAKQSHCVGSYAAEHAKGKTTILFIRKKIAPGIPYFTLEMDMVSRKVRQCYGKGNKESYHTNLEVGQLLEHYIRHLEWCAKNKKGIKTA